MKAIILYILDMWFMFVAWFNSLFDYNVKKVLFIDNKTGDVYNMTKKFRYGFCNLWSVYYFQDMVQDIARELEVSDYRIEVRYILKGSKYRVVYNWNDCMFYPLYQDDGKIQRMKKIMYATFDELDVTKRLLKYAGPNYDFHTSLLCPPKVSWIFPKFKKIPDDSLHINTVVHKMILKLNDRLVIS